jgi:type I restriction enzyme S subunit
VKAGWEQAKLGDICELIARGGAPKYTDEGGVCVLNQKCVRDHNINYDLARRHNSEIKKVRPDRFVRLGDVLVNSTGVGTLGRVAQVRSEPAELTTVDTHVTIVRPPLDRFYSDFFGYAMIAIEDQIAAGGMGASGQTELSRTSLAEDYEITFPTSIEEQRRIVAVLDEAFEGLARARANVEANVADAEALRVRGIAKTLERFGQEFATINLPEVSENLDRQRVPITKRDRKPGNVPYYGASGQVDSVSDALFDEPLLLRSRLNQVQKAMMVARAAAERKFLASLS